MRGCKILIDNGHSAETPGKCSPDGQLKEYSYTREIARMVISQLTKESIDATLLVKEENDVPLTERIERVNRFCIANRNEQVVLVSIHCNAADSDGNWHEARGFSAFVSHNASRKSKRLAEIFNCQAERLGLKVRKYSPKQNFWSSNLAICRRTKCPAVLTENLFQDNKDDVAFLLSQEGKQTIATLHINSIKQYLSGL